MWVPFAIIMEVSHDGSIPVCILILFQFLKESPPTTETSVPPVRPSRNRFLSTPPNRRVNGERQPLIRRRSLGEYEAGPEAESLVQTTGGTVLGIHNLAIVMPQFIVSLSVPLLHRS
jgi:solute carrier family 45 protein 1/2/4